MCVRTYGTPLLCMCSFNLHIMWRQQVYHFFVSCSSHHKSRPTKKYTHTSQLVRMPQLRQQRKDRQISQGVWRAHISALHDDIITIICKVSKQLILASCYIDKHFTMQTSSSVSREGCEVKKCAASEPSRINTFTTVILANTPTLHPENHAHVVCTYV